MFRLLGVFDQNLATGGGGGGPAFGDAEVFTPALTVGVTARGSYSFNSLLGKLEANRPPSIDDCYISGDLIEGGTINFNVVGHRIYNMGFFAPTRFRLFSSGDMQGAGEVLIYDGTSTSYVLTAAEAAKRLRLEAEPRQTGGMNLTGEIVKSPYTGVVAGTSFNPINDINWNAAYVKSTLINFNSSPVWANSKGGFTSCVQDGVRPLPVYNSTEQALEFTRASSTILAYTKNVALGQPYEWVIRFKLKSLTGTQYLLSFNNSIYVTVTSTGALNISGSVSAAGVIAAGNWYVLRVVQSGASSLYELNFNGVEVAAATASATASGTGTGRVGASWGNTNFLDGYISEVFIGDTLLTSGEKTNMKNWFGL